MRINLVSRDNGAGLTTDALLLADLFAEHDVRRVEWTDADAPACDVAIFLELWNPRQAQRARATVGIFNLEWFERAWQTALPRLTQLWAKSHEAYYAYQRLGLQNARYTGFVGRDIYDPDVSRELACLHVRGRSGFKGTDLVLEAWRHYRDLPPLTVISLAPLAAPPGVRVVPWCSEEELRREMNRCIIHICPSVAEGWGHYIVEGLSAGAVVITTDASPMSEHIAPNHGYLLPVLWHQPRGLVQLHVTDGHEIARAVRLAAALRAEERAQMTGRARAKFLARNACFARVAKDALGELC